MKKIDKPIVLFVAMLLCFSSVFAFMPNRISAFDASLYKIAEMKIDDVDAGSTYTTKKADSSFTLKVSALVDASAAGNNLVVSIPRGLQLVSATGVDSVNASTGALTTSPYKPDEALMFSSFPTFSKGEDVALDATGALTTSKIHTNSGTLTYPIKDFDTAGAIISVTVKPDTRLHDRTNSMNLTDKLKVSLKNGVDTYASKEVGITIPGTFSLNIDTVSSTELVGATVNSYFYLRNLMNTSSDFEVSWRDLEFDYTYPTGAILQMNSGYTKVSSINNGDGTTTAHVKYAGKLDTISRTQILFAKLTLPEVEFPVGTVVPTTIKNIKLGFYDTINAKAADNNKTFTHVLSQNFTMRAANPFGFNLTSANASNPYLGENAEMELSRFQLSVTGDKDQVIETTKKTKVIYKFDLAQRDHIYGVSVPFNDREITIDLLEKVRYKYYGDDTIYTWTKGDADNPFTLTLLTYYDRSIAIKAKDTTVSFEMIEATVSNLTATGSNNAKGAMFGRPEYTEESKNNYSVNTLTVTAGGITKSISSGFKFKPNSETNYKYWGKGDSYKPTISSATGMSAVDAGNNLEISTSFNTEFGDGGINDVGLYVAVPKGSSLIDVYLYKSNTKIELKDPIYIRDVSESESGTLGGATLYLVQPKNEFNISGSDSSPIYKFGCIINVAANSKSQTWDGGKIIGMLAQKETGEIKESASSTYYNGVFHRADPYRIKIKDADGNEVDANQQKDKVVIAPRTKININSLVGLLVDVYAKETETSEPTKSLKVLAGDHYYLEYVISNSVTQGGNVSYAFLPFPQTGENVNGVGKYDSTYVGTPINISVDKQPGSTLTYDIVYGKVGTFDKITATNYPDTDLSKWHTSPQAGDNMILVVLNNPIYQDSIRFTQKMKMEDGNDKYNETQTSSFTSTGLYFNGGVVATTQSSDIALTVNYFQERELTFVAGDDSKYLTPATGTMTPIMKEVGASQPFGDTTFQRLGYDFAGWKVIEVDGVPVSDNTIYLADDLYKMPLAPVKIEAQWKLSPRVVSIKKTAVGDYANSEAIFEYKLVFKNTDGSFMAKGTKFAYTGAIEFPKTGELVIGDNGEAVIKLRKNQTIKIQGLTIEQSIEVIESPLTNYELSKIVVDGSEITPVGNSSGEVKIAGANRSIEFVNQTNIIETGLDSGNGNGFIEISLFALMLLFGLWEAIKIRKQLK